MRDLLAQAEASLQLAAPRVASLPHVLGLVSAFLDVSVLQTPPHAAATRSQRLFDRVVERVERDMTLDRALRSHWYSRAMEVALKNNDLAMAQKIHMIHPEPFATWPLQLALQHGSLETVQWVVEHRNDRLCCERGVGNLCVMCLSTCLKTVGHQDSRRVVEWLITHANVRYDDGAWNVHWTHPWSALLQNVDLLRWFDGNKWLSSKDANWLLVRVLDGSYTANVEAARYLVARPATVWDTDDIFHALIHGGCPRDTEDIVEIVVTSPLCDPFRDKFVYASTRSGGSKILQWDARFMGELKFNGMVNMSQLAECISQYGSIDAVRWLVVERGVTPTTFPSRDVKSDEEAVGYLKWVKDADILIQPPKAATILAERGFLEAINLLHEYFYYDTWGQRRAEDVWGCSVMDTAAKYGHLHVVEWLAANTAETCSYRAMNSAARNGHLAVVKWLYHHTSDGDANDAMVRAALHGHLEVIEWLYSNAENCCTQCVVNAVLLSAERPRDGGIGQHRFAVLHTLPWLQTRLAAHPSCEDGCANPSWSGFLLQHAAGAGDGSLLKYLYRHHPDQFTRRIANTSRLLMQNMEHSTAFFQT